MIKFFKSAIQVAKKFAQACLKPFVNPVETSVSISKETRKEAIQKVLAIHHYNMALTRRMLGTTMVIVGLTVSTVMAAAFLIGLTTWTLATSTMEVVISPTIISIYLLGEAINWSICGVIIAIKSPFKLFKKQESSKLEIIDIWKPDLKTPDVITDPWKEENFTFNDEEIFKTDSQPETISTGIKWEIPSNLSDANIWSKERLVEYLENLQKAFPQAKLNYNLNSPRKRLVKRIERFFLQNQYQQPLTENLISIA